MCEITSEDMDEMCGGYVMSVDGYDWDVSAKTVTWRVRGSDNKNHSISALYKLVSRDDAMEITGETDHRIRNYELEMELHDLDIGYFIYKDCPINGFKTVPDHIVEQHIREMKA